MAKVEEEGGIIWGELPTTQKRGSCCIKEYTYRLPDGQTVKNNSYISYGNKKGYVSFVIDGFYFFPSYSDKHSGYMASGILLDVKETSKWIIDNNIPRFIDDGRNYIEKLIDIEHE